MKLSNAMLLLITGFTAGAVTGILMAPEEGYKTRRKLKRKAKKYKQQLERTASDYKDKATDIRDNIEGVVHDVKKRFA
ncbi:MAG TPA: YtxH domain-containing protein [Hanamia sp.]